MKTQADKIATVLERGETITQVQAARRFNIWRLSSVINRLRDAGYNIDTLKIRGSRSGRYKLIGGAP